MIDRAEVRRFLGSKNGDFLKEDTRFEAVLTEALESVDRWLTPKAIFRLAAGSDLARWFPFCDLEQIALAVCTIGLGLEEEVTRLSQAGKMLQAIVLDAIGSTAAESAAGAVERRIAEYAAGRGLRTSCRVSPGYGQWDIRGQGELFSLVDAGPIGVSLGDTFMMTPRKSVSFALHIAQEPARLRNPDSCADCNLRHCPYSRQPILNLEGKGN